MSAAPIADLSYRSYDGPLSEPRYRWWVIAKMLIRQTFKKRAFWVWTIFAGVHFYIMSIILYFLESQIDPLRPQAGQQMLQFMKAIVWKDIFLDGFGHMQLFLLFIALLAGAGAIANDNRANALLVYLSKPCRKQDYLLGKWIGLAILISGVALAQLTLFYLYGLMSYRDYGFFTQDKLLYLKLVLISIVPGVLYSSITLGVSSMFNQGRMAGATLAGLYFISFFFTTTAMVVRVVMMEDGKRAPGILDAITYASLDGMNIGLAKVILDTSGSIFNPGQRRGGGGPPQITLVPPPNGVLFLTIGVIVCAFFMWIAWKRVRAVEVIG